MSSKEEGESKSSSESAEDPSWDAEESDSSEKSEKDHSSNESPSAEHSERDHSPPRMAGSQLRDHIKKGKDTPADRGAVLVFCAHPSITNYTYTIPAAEMKMSHLELFECWSRCEDIYTDSDTHVPEYLSYVEFDVHEFLRDKWHHYRNHNAVIELDGAYRMYRINAAQK